MSFVKRMTETMLVKKHLLLFFLLIVIGKLSGFGKDLSLSYYHGASHLTDAFFVATSVSSLVYAALYLSVPAIVIPTYSKLKDSEDDHLSSILHSFLALSAGLSVFVYVFSDDLISLLSHESLAWRHEAATYLKVISVSFVLSTGVGFFNSIQVVENKKISSYIVPIVNNGAFIFALALFSAESDFLWVVWSGVAAWFCMLILNAYGTNSFFRYRVTTKLDLFAKRKVLCIFLPVFMTFGVEQINSYVSVFFASTLGEGSVSYISYANKLNLILVSVFMVFLTTHIFPELAKKSAERDMNSLGSMVRSFFVWILILCPPILMLVFSHASEIVSVVFERGQFGRHEVFEVSSILGLLMLSLPFALLRDYFNRVSFSLDNSWIPFLSIVIATIFHVVASYFLSREWGGRGIVAAVSLSVAMHVFVLLSLMRVFLSIKFFQGLWKTCLLVGLSYLLALAFEGYISYFFDLNWFLIAAGQLLVYFLPFLIFLGKFRMGKSRRPLV